MRKEAHEVITPRVNEIRRAGGAPKATAPSPARLSQRELVVQSLVRCPPPRNGGRR